MAATRGASTAVWWILMSSSSFAVSDMQNNAACPEGYFRRSVITFKCNTTTGISHVLLPPTSTRDVGYIGTGVTDFVLNAKSHMDIDVVLINATSITNAPPLQQGAGEEDLNGSTTAIEGNGSTLVSTNRVNISGCVSSPLILRLRSLGSGWGTVTLEYAYAGTVPCPNVPVGCDPFDSVAAKEGVAAWSARMQSKYPSADEAWLGLAARFAELSTRSIPWFRWQAAWPDTAGAPGHFLDADAVSAAMAFHFLDTDRDGLICRTEFTVGYDGNVSWSIPSPMDPAISTAPGFDDVAVDEPRPRVPGSAATSTSEAADLGVGWAPLGVANELYGQTQRLGDAGTSAWQTLVDSGPGAVVCVVVGTLLSVVLVLVGLFLVSSRHRESGQTRSMHAHDLEGEEYLAASAATSSDSKIGDLRPAGQEACPGGPGGLAGTTSPDVLRTWANHLQLVGWQGLQAQAPFRYTPLPTYDSYPGPPQGSSWSFAGAQLQAPLTARSTAQSTPRGIFRSLAGAQLQAPFTAQPAAPSSPRGAVRSFAGSQLQAPLTALGAQLQAPVTARSAAPSSPRAVQACTPVPVETATRARAPDPRAMPAARAGRERGAPLPEHTTLSVLEVQDESGISLGPHSQPWPWAAFLDPEPRGASAQTTSVPVHVMQADREGGGWRLSEGYSH